MNFDLQSYLKEIQSRQSSRFNRSNTKVSIDTESLFTDRNDEPNLMRYSHLNYRPVAVKVVEIQKPYVVEDYFPKSQSRNMDRYSKASSQRSTSVMSNKENIPSILNISSYSKKDWEDKSTDKISNRNPLMSFDYRSDASPSNPRHHHRSTADFPQPYRPKAKPVNIPLTLCTCILAGKLYTHTKDCSKVQVIVQKGRVKKRFSVVEACVKIQREFRKFLRNRKQTERDSIDFPLFTDISKCRPKRIISSDLESYTFSLDSVDQAEELEGSQRFLGRVVISGERFKDFRSDLEESVDFELSSTFK